MSAGQILAPLRYPASRVIGPTAGGAVYWTYNLLDSSEAVLYSFGQRDSDNPIYGNLTGTGSQYPITMSGKAWDKWWWRTKSFSYKITQLDPDTHLEITLAGADNFLWPGNETELKKIKPRNPATAEDDYASIEINDPFVFKLYKSGVLRSLSIIPIIIIGKYSIYPEPQNAFNDSEFGTAESISITGSVDASFVPEQTYRPQYDIKPMIGVMPAMSMTLNFSDGTVYEYLDQPIMSTSVTLRGPVYNSTTHETAQGVESPGAEWGFDDDTLELKCEFTFHVDGIATGFKFSIKPDQYCTWGGTVDGDTGEYLG